MALPRILLINPKTVNKYYHVVQTPVDRMISTFFRWSYDRHFDIPTHAHCTTLPPISLFALQALIGGRADVTIVDEQVDAIDFEADADLVCVTATTPQMRRACEISHRFLARGIPTALGGVHATCRPDECAGHFHTVCEGEAEGYLHELLDDLAAGALARRYRNRRVIPLDETPFYRYEIGTGKYLPFHVINFSRGCPFKCEFCSIQATLGSFRTRSVASVVREIERVGAKHLWFPDATLTASKPRAKELFRALAPLKVRWLSQITLNVAQDMEMLDLMAASGCWLVSIGFETLSEKNIRTAAKFQNKVRDYENVIRELHARGIAIEGNFVFGFDEDTPDSFQATAGFVLEHGVDLPEFYVLTPYPDTELFQRYHAQGRIRDYNWSHYDNTHFHHLPVFEPKGMSREALRDGCIEAERRVYGRSNTLRRIWRSGVYRGPALMANYIYASRIRRRHTLLPGAEVLDDGPMPAPWYDPAEHPPAAAAAGA